MNEKPTRLGGIVGNGVGKPTPTPTTLGRILSTGQRGEEVTLPVLGRVWIELPGSREWQEIEAAARRELRRLEVDPESIQGAPSYEAELALRVLSVAVRDPASDKRATAFGTLEEWGKLDNDIVNVAWHAFGDVRQRLDPIAVLLDETDSAGIAVAVKKKDGPSLRAFGTVKLAAWLCATGALQSSSPSPSSPSTDSPSDSSGSPTS